MKIKTILSSTPVVAFIGFWIFAAILYGDVFYMAEQYSLFAFDQQIMVLWYLIQKGQNLYYQQEPSVVFLWLLVVFILAALVSIVSHFIAGKPSHPVSPSRWGQGICSVFLELYLYTQIGKENKKLIKRKEVLLLIKTIDI